ncbi:SET domain-containing protein-lysine N-methyltransferase [candidate division WWE3 bacterium]|uniref:SET domain-containing protein-lysine N-methyltransferase n=1 Tax=candidate division WWE3 bacterium TaxID=2053526 RepID=A0A955LJG1_UNCKA|nr:SET domain-containing protein-lysine N-methyltransferase [candidate division WWE3 bacterium]
MGDWLSSKVEIRESKINGKGMYAIRDIRKGEKLVEWKGNYTDAKGAEEQRNNGKMVMQWDTDLFSYEDWGVEDGYFTNHSCDGNMWMNGAYTLSARHDISAGEELTADYALWEADPDYVSDWKCVCGSEKCRGKVTGHDWEIPELQKRYYRHFSPLLNKRIENTRTTSWGMFRYSQVFFKAYTLTENNAHGTADYYPADFFLALRSIELMLKAVLREEGVDVFDLKNLGHDLPKMLNLFKEYIALGEKESEVIVMLWEYYKSKEFEYPVTGYKRLVSDTDLSYAVYKISDKVEKYFTDRKNAAKK